MAKRFHTEPSWSNEPTTWSPERAKESGFHVKTSEPQSRAELLCEQERWDELCAHYLELAVATPAPDLARALCMEALGLADLARDPRRVVRAVHARIVAVDPSDSEAFETLAGIYRDEREGELLVELLLDRIERRPEIEAKTALLERIAIAFEELLDDPAQAFDARLAALDLGAPTPVTTSRLATSASELGRWDELAQKAAARLKVSPADVAALRLRAAFHRTRGDDAEEARSLAEGFQHALAPGDRVAILVEMGELCERTNDETAKIVTLYERALEIDERCLPALKGLSRVLLAAGSYKELSAVLERRLAAASDADSAAAVQCELASILEKHLGEPERAAELYRTALSTERGRAAAWAGLERIYTATRRFADLAAILEEGARSASTPVAAADTLVRLGEIQRVHFLRPDLARGCFEAALERVPTHMPALDSLAACHRAERRASDWIDTLERKLRVLRKRDEILPLARSLVEACAVEIGDAERGMQIFERWIGDAELAPGWWPRLVDKAGSNERAVEFLRRVLERTREPSERVELHAELGRRALEMDEIDLAVAELQSALAIDPRHRASLVRLRAAMEERGSAGRALALLEREQETVQSPRERASLLCDIADNYWSLGEEERALGQYARALELDPRQDRAAWPLFARAIAHEDWESAVRLAEDLRVRLRCRPVADQVWFRRQHGRALRALGDLQGARRALIAAHQIDPKDTTVLAELGELSFSLGDWKNASIEHTRLLSLLPESDRASRARTFFRLGLLERHLGRPREAVRAFERALSIGTMRAQALDSLVETYDLLGDTKRACLAIEQRIEIETDEARVVELLVDLARRLSAQADGRSRAAACYERALAIDPRCRRGLVGLLAFYQETGRWDGVLSTLERLHDLEPEPEGKALSRYAMAQVYRDVFGDHDKALRLFEESLDLDPTRLAAFEQIDKILTGARDWSRLERAYRHMIRRLERTGTPELAERLWHSLGLIYRDRLGDHGRAIEAFSVVKTLAPQARECRAILAELYDLTGRSEAAIAERHGLLELDPRDTSVLAALVAAYRARGEEDAAWCVATAVSSLGGGSTTATEIASSSVTIPLSGADSALSEGQWRALVCHRELCPHLDLIFKQIAPAVIRARAGDLAAKGELPQLRPDLRDGGTSRVGRAFALASRLLGTYAPPLFVRADLPGTLSMTPTLELGPVSVAGRTALEGLPDAALAFVVGRHVSAYRPEWILRALFPTTSELTVLFHAAMALVVPAWQVPAAIAPAARATAVLLARAMTPAEIEQLGLVVGRFRAAGKVADLEAWGRRVDMTLARAGLLVSGDLVSAERLLRAEPQRAGDDLEERVADLYFFATSRPYLTLRRTLGIMRGRRA